MFPIHLNLGFRVFYYYEGFYFLVAIGTAYLVAWKRLQRAGLDVRVFEDSFIWILLGAILGARVFQFAFWDLQSFLDDPATFLRIWDGGLSITGGLAGGALGALICFRRQKVDFWAYSATLSPAVLIGQAVGRVGCFLNGDAYGIPTSLPWGVREPRFGVFVPSFVPDHTMPSAAWAWCVDKGFVSPSAMATVPLHPTQLYEAAGDLVLAVLVIRLARSQRARKAHLAKVTWLFLGGYSLFRFGLEFLHGDRDITVWAGMTALQLGLLAFGAVSAALYVRAD
ncbi:MAG: prolipoprotein diacylglyceryl transferase [Holophaga sp.]|nr:prolipoprotein diacylglyceryl transferase [Holophaga sp.]